MKPTLILPRMAMSMQDIDALRANGICVVEVADPDLIKFVDVPISDRGFIDQAAITLVREIVSGRLSTGSDSGDSGLRIKLARKVVAAIEQSESLPAVHSRTTKRKQSKTK